MMDDFNPDSSFEPGPNLGQFGTDLPHSGIPRPRDNPVLEYLRRRLTRAPSITMSPFMPMKASPTGVKGEIEDVKFLIEALRGRQNAR